MIRPITKLARQIVDGNNVPALVRKCFWLTESEKHGAVLLELQEDIAAAPAERKPFEITTVDPPGASQAALRRAVQMTHDAKRPLLLLGSGANRDRTHNAARELVEKVVPCPLFRWCQISSCDGIMGSS